MAKLKERIPEASENFGKLVMARSEKADHYHAEVCRIMDLVGIGGRFFISDESTFSDLPIDDYTELSQELGIDIKPSDYIADIAEKLSNLK